MKTLKIIMITLALGFPAHAININFAPTSDVHSTAYRRGYYPEYEPTSGWRFILRGCGCGKWAFRGGGDLGVLEWFYGGCLEREQYGGRLCVGFWGVRLCPGRAGRIFDQWFLPGFQWDWLHGRAPAGRLLHWVKFPGPFTMISTATWRFGRL